jgi:hypothetical protein
LIDQPLVNSTDGIRMNIASTRDLPGTWKFFSNREIARRNGKSYLGRELIADRHFRIFGDPDLHKHE